MRAGNVVRNLAAAAVSTGLAVIGVATPAHAASTDAFSVCYNRDACSRDGETSGLITWHNRTATVTGSVIDGGDDELYVEAVFEAYAGSVKVDSTTRAANFNSSLGAVRSFSFTIGDTNRPGGIDRIKITVCLAGQVCGGPENYSKN